ncbi:MAG: DUF86 domain-containing protein [Rhodocyclales bacterium]|nr:DUF86 domain-containing protein [Rhodocyclales bacterium]
MSEPGNSRAFDYLDHMVEAITLAMSFTEGMAKEDFLADRKTQQAVILNLIVLGEAASKIASECPEFTAAHPALPWQQMRGMRNRMAHGYFDIDLDVVWETVQTSLPALLRQIVAIVR